MDSVKLCGLRRKRAVSSPHHDFDIPHPCLWPTALPVPRCPMKRARLTLWLVLLLAAAAGRPAAAQTFNVGANFTTTTLESSFAAFGTNLEPPDTMGAAGVQHFVAFNNGNFSVFNKNGSLVSQVSDTSFWTTALGASPGGGGSI